MLLAPVQLCTPRPSARDRDRAAEDLQLLLQVSWGAGCIALRYAAPRNAILCSEPPSECCLLCPVVQNGELPGSRQRLARLLKHADNLGSEAFAGEHC
jgi:hypothetical protein